MRRVCDHCKEIYTPTPEDVEIYVKEKGSGPGQLIHGRGCELCNKTRYHGRVGIFEMLELDDTVRSLVFTGAGETEFKQELSLRGFRGLTAEGLRMVDEGTTSVKEFVRTMYDAR